MAAATKTALSASLCNADPTASDAKTASLPQEIRAHMASSSTVHCPFRPVVAIDYLDYIQATAQDGSTTPSESKRLDMQHALTAAVHECLQVQQAPLVIRNLHRAPSWPFQPSEFGLEPCPRHHDTTSACPISTGPDSSNMRCSSSEWASRLASLLPSALVAQGADDLLAHLPEALQPESLVAVTLGSESCPAPGRTYPCSMLGHNLMVHLSEPPRADETYALWCIMCPADRPCVEEFWAKAAGLPHALSLSQHVVDLRDLSLAPFPVFVCEQRLGDLVLLPGEAPYQAAHRGSHTTSLSWSRMTPQTLEYFYHHVAPVYSRICRPEVYRTKSICYFGIQSLIEKAACGAFAYSGQKGTREAAQRLKELAQLCAILAAMIEDEHIVEVDATHLFDAVPIDATVEVPHSRTCDYCQADIWNRSYHCDACNACEANYLLDSPDTLSSAGIRGIDLCLACYARGRTCAKHPRMQLIQVFSLDEPLDMLEAAETAVLAGLRTLPAELQFRYEPAHLRQRLASAEARSPANGQLSFRLWQQRQSCELRVCHQCRATTTNRGYLFITCPGKGAGAHTFCDHCLWLHYGIESHEASRSAATYGCPLCTQRCLCQACCLVRREPWRPGALAETQAQARAKARARASALLPWMGRIVDSASAAAAPSAEPRQPADHSQSARALCKAPMKESVSIMNIACRPRAVTALSSALPAAARTNRSPSPFVSTAALKFIQNTYFDRLVNVWTGRLRRRLREKNASKHESFVLLDLHATLVDLLQGNIEDAAVALWPPAAEAGALSPLGSPKSGPCSAYTRSEQPISPRSVHAKPGTAEKSVDLLSLLIDPRELTPELFEQDFARLLRPSLSLCVRMKEHGKREALNTIPYQAIVDKRKSSMPSINLPLCAPGKAKGQALTQEPTLLAERLSDATRRSSEPISGGLHSSASKKLAAGKAGMHESSAPAAKQTHEHLVPLGETLKISDTAAQDSLITSSSKDESEHSVPLSSPSAATGPQTSTSTPTLDCAALKLQESSSTMTQPGPTTVATAASQCLDEVSPAASLRESALSPSKALSVSSALSALAAGSTAHWGILSQIEMANPWAPKSDAPIERSPVAVALHCAKEADQQLQAAEREAPGLWSINPYRFSGPVVDARPHILYSEEAMPNSDGTVENVVDLPGNSSLHSGSRDTMTMPLARFESTEHVEISRLDCQHSRPLIHIDPIITREFVSSILAEHSWTDASLGSSMPREILQASYSLVPAARAVRELSSLSGCDAESHRAHEKA